MRFASLNAHHDSGIKGINTDIAERLVKILEPFGTIYITSERPLEPQFESACAKFLTYFIENYPQSAQETKNADSAWWEQFK